MARRDVPPEGLALSGAQVNINRSAAVPKLPDIHARPAQTLAPAPKSDPSAAAPGQTRHDSKLRVTDETASPEGGPAPVVAAAAALFARPATTKPEVERIIYSRGRTPMPDPKVLDAVPPTPTPEPRLEELSVNPFALAAERLHGFEDIAATLRAFEELEWAEEPELAPPESEMHPRVSHPGSAAAQTETTADKPSITESDDTSEAGASTAQKGDASDLEQSNSRRSTASGPANASLPTVTLESAAPTPWPDDPSPSLTSTDAQQTLPTRGTTLLDSNSGFLLVGNALRAPDSFARAWSVPKGKEADALARAFAEAEHSIHEAAQTKRFRDQIEQYDRDMALVEKLRKHHETDTLESLGVTVASSKFDSCLPIYQACLLAHSTVILPRVAVETPELIEALEQARLLVVERHDTTGTMPNDIARALVEQGEIELRMGRLQAAVQTLNEAIKVQPRLWRARWQKHLALLGMRDVHNAIIEADRITLSTQDYAAHRSKGDIYFARHDYTGAATAYQDARDNAEQATSDVLMVLQVDAGHEKARLYFADLSYRRGNYGQAVRAYTELLEEQPDSATLYMARAKANVGAKAAIEALRDVVQCLHLDPNCAEAYFYRALMLLEARPRQALKDFSLTLLLDMGTELTTRALLQRGILYAKLNEHVCPALSICRETRSNLRRQHCLSYALGRYISSTPQVQAMSDLFACLRAEDLRCLRSDIGISNLMIDIYCQIGLVYLRSLGKIATAIKYFSKAISLRSDCEAALLARAEAFVTLHKLMPHAATNSTMLLRAQRDLTRLMHIRPEVLHYRLKAARVCMDAGREEAATNLLRSAKVNLSLNLLTVQAYVRLSSLEASNCPVCLRFAVSVNQKPHQLMHSSLNVWIDGSTLQIYLGLEHEVGDMLCQLVYPKNDSATYILLFKHSPSWSRGAWQPAQMYGVALSKATMATRMYPQTVTLIQQLMKHLHPTEDLCCDLAAAALECHRTVLAQIACGQALEAKPDSARALRLVIDSRRRVARAYLLRACFRVEQGQPSVALPDFRTALRLQPQSVLVHYNFGLALALLNEQAEALKLFETGLGLVHATVDSPNAPAKSLHASLLHNAAVVNFHLEEYAAALGCFKQLLDLVPEQASDVDTLITMALTCYHMRDLASAVQLFSRVIDLNPRMMVAYLGRANVLMDIDTEACWLLSRRDYARAIHLDPEDPRPYLNLGIGATTCVTRAVVAQYLQQVAVAVADLQLALKIDPECILALYNLALMYVAKRQLTQAEDTIARAMAIDRSAAQRRLRQQAVDDELSDATLLPHLDGQLFLVAAQIALQRKAWQKAEELLCQAETCKNLDPEDKTILVGWNRALMFYHRDNFAAAHAALQPVLALRPDDDGAKMLAALMHDYGQDSAPVGSNAKKQLRLTAATLPSAARK
ncbi:uncharacterized protein MONBRDRAFT_9566 [Monosiga brevicollis MX1]|uniref:Uncharacterized protein n=1 Tax=Monosiga brevicollis TaxID=81824 RepID=A9V3Q0_MONBE|nr:uncharacterized protein MONBRDRAFT_9566 [Monosiga brevicollis MX1]EDQ87743.1 predicted protein [Monosiga brevicollis MX1]|eukprot:XP_001747276.1 hypothetical protein [Monosiga brevicollis MX1]